MSFRITTVLSVAPRLSMVLFAMLAAALASPAMAQSGALVRQDFSDCGNNNVSASDPSRIGGGVTITQSAAGATTAAVQITHGTAGTAYTFYWKCQRALGAVSTDGRGAGSARFAFQATAGAVLTFDMYPAGAPLGNKFQSVRITPVLAGNQRKSILQLSAAELASLRRGVAQMMAWNSAPRGSANYKRSWVYWANMHAYFGTGCASVSGLGAAGMSGLSAQAKTTPDETATWCSCQHGNVQFLTWHRMYLYYFEQVLQAAAGDPTLRLPFWDYESNGQLPAAYRDATYVNGGGQTVANPLYIANRQAQLDSGTASLTGSVVSTSGAMGQTSYASFNSFIEGAPHGSVHCAVAVGNCPTGYMGAVPAAGNDPIFYSHHANIDRLYECWLGINPAARLPSDPAQLNATFSFIDGAGNLVTRRVGDMLTLAQLGYSYAAGGGCPAARIKVNVATRAGMARVLSLAGSTALARGTTVVPVRIAAEARTAMTTSAAAAVDGTAPRALLVIDGLTFDEAPGVLYEVYVQDAAGKRALLGVINFFNMTAPHMDMKGMADGAPGRTVFDATDALRTIGSGDTSLVIEPITGVTGVSPAAAAERISPRANVRFTSVRIELR